MRKIGPNKRIRKDAKDTYFNFALRQARIDAGLKCSELSALVGVSPASISNYERLRTTPEPENAEKIAQALGKPVEVLFPEIIRGMVAWVREDRSRDWDFESLTDISQENHPLVDYTELVDDRLDVEWLRRALKGQEKRTQQILKLRYGLNGNEPLTIKEVGKVLGLSGSRVSQIELEALYFFAVEYSRVPSAETKAELLEESEVETPSTLKRSLSKHKTLKEPIKQNVSEETKTQRVYDLLEVVRENYPALFLEELGKTFGGVAGLENCYRTMLHGHKSVRARVLVSGEEVGTFSWILDRGRLSSVEYYGARKDPVCFVAKRAYFGGYGWSRMDMWPISVFPGFYGSETILQRPYRQPFLGSGKIVQPIVDAI